MALTYANYNSPLQNADLIRSVVLEPGGRPILRPLLREEGLALRGQTIDDIPVNIRNEWLSGRFYWDYTEDAEGNGTLKVDDATQLQIPLYAADPSVVTDGQDIVYFTGWVPGSLASDPVNDEEPCINALVLAAVRFGNGDDELHIAGVGITQRTRSEVSLDESNGYIFQSTIFMGDGDDYASPLMPWQSTFKGGNNTDYSGSLLGDDLTVEELPGDVIELKGSRFDWDLEFRHVSQDDNDPSNDQNPTLASYLAGTSDIATSNNNKIYEFERILFGDILLDVVVYDQLESGALFGQPEYYLNGVEDPAATLNSTLARGSELWEAFRFNRTILQGISGAAADPIDVYTGDAEDTPFLVGALQFANLYTEADADTVGVGSISSASVDLGADNDLLRSNGAVSSSQLKGDAGADTFEAQSLVSSTLDGGSGNDLIWLKGAATDSLNSFIDGGDGQDVLKLAGALASYSLEKRTDGSYDDGAGNSYHNFESFVFSDGNYASTTALDTALAALAAATDSGGSSGGGGTSGGSGGGTSSGGGASGGGGGSSGGGTATPATPATTTTAEQVFSSADTTSSIASPSTNTSSAINQLQLPGGGLLITANPSAADTPFFQLTGSTSNDVITGTFGSQVLDGQGGSDEMTGGPGPDIFRLAFGDSQPDVLVDFTKGEDKVQLAGVPRGSIIDRKLKGATSSKKAMSTAEGTKQSKAAQSLFVYDSNNGKLFYNANLKKKGFGSGGGKIAELPFGLKLDGRDLQIAYADPLA